MAGQAARIDVPPTKLSNVAPTKKPMPLEPYTVNELLQLAIQEDHFLESGAFNDLQLRNPGKNFNLFHFDRRIRSGLYRGYRYDELLTEPSYIAHVYKSGSKPGMEAIKAYYNFAMKHQIAVSAGKDA